MPRFFIGWLLGLGGAAIGLLLSTLVFGDDFSFNGSITGFLVALLVFAVLSALLPIFILKALVRHAGSIAALSGLFSTFIALLVTTLVSSLTINGPSTWLLATLLIWVLGMVIWLIPGPWRSYAKNSVRK